MRRSTFLLPTPTGSFGVGKTSYHAVDASRKEKYSSDSNHPYREFNIHIWYPAQIVVPTNPAEYIPSKSQAYIKNKRAEGKRLPGLIEAEVTTNTYLNIPLSKNNQRYPVLLFSHGFGVPHYAYSSLLEELASHGYIVVAADHTYKTEPTELPDGRIIGLADEWRTNLAHMEKFEEAADQEMVEWVTDLQFVLSYLETINQQDPKHILTKRLDLTRIGAFGHSFGGAAVTNLCKNDQRCKAAVNIDGCLFGADIMQGFHKPYMLLLAGNHEFSLQEHEGFGGKQKFNDFIKRHTDRIKEFYQNLTDSKYDVTLKDAEHMSFSDIGLFSSKNDQARFVQLTRQLLVTFFNTHLSPTNHDGSYEIH